MATRSRPCLHWRPRHTEYTSAIGDGWPLHPPCTDAVAHWRHWRPECASTIRVQGPVQLHLRVKAGGYSGPCSACGLSHIRVISESYPSHIYSVARRQYMRLRPGRIRVTSVPSWIPSSFIQLLVSVCVFLRIENNGPLGFRQVSFAREANGHIRALLDSVNPGGHGQRFLRPRRKRVKPVQVGIFS